jgi:hypothetical protein
MLLALQNAIRGTSRQECARSYKRTFLVPVLRTWIDSLLKNDLTALFLSYKLLLVALWHWLRDLPNPEMHSLSEHLSSLIYRFRVFFL